MRLTAKISLLLILFCVTFIEINARNAYDLEALCDETADKIDATTLQLYAEILELEHRAANNKNGGGLYHKNLGVPKQPQWIMRYDLSKQTLIVWVVGTETAWDWGNLAECSPTPMIWGKHNIGVHSGVLKAVNILAPILFEQMLKIIQHISKHIATMIERIIFSGHSQGGAISELILLSLKANLLNIKGHEKCTVTNAFEAMVEHINGLGHPVFETVTGKTLAEVIISKMRFFGIGSFTTIDYKNAYLMDHIYGKLFDKVIEAKDPGPMLFVGNSKMTDDFPPEKGVTAVFINKWAQGMMDHYFETPYYGNIGEFHVIMKNNDGHLILRKLNKYDDGIGAAHLLNGAKLLRKHNKEIMNLWNLINSHLYEVYRKDVTALAETYTKKKQMYFYFVDYNNNNNNHGIGRDGFYGLEMLSLAIWVGILFGLLVCIMVLVPLVAMCLCVVNGGKLSM